MSNINTLIGDRIVENIVKGEKDFSFETDDLEGKYVTIDFNGIKSVFGSTFRKNEKPGETVVIPRCTLTLNAVYVDFSRILLMNPLQSSKQEAVSIEDVREQIQQKVISAADDLVQKVSVDKYVNKEMFLKNNQKFIEKISWLLALDDLEPEDLYPSIELTDQDVIYVWLTYDSDDIVERWFYKNLESIRRGRMIQEAAKKKVPEYKNNRLIDLFNILKDMTPDILNIVTVSYDVEIRHFISHDGLLDGIRNRFEDIPAFGGKADDITSVYVGKNLIWKKEN